MTKEDEIKNEINETAVEVPVTEPEVLADTPTPAPEEAVVAPNTPPQSANTPNIQSAPPNTGKDRGFKRGGRRTGGRPRRSQFEKAKPEFDQKTIEIRRVTRVVAGGRRFSFSVALVIGDRKGSLGVGTGKAGDTSLAIEKAFRDARKNLFKIQLTKGMSIPHQVEAKYSSARIKMLPNKGKGLVVGSAARIALDLAGVKDVTGKILSGSKNQLNIARATVKALMNLTPPRE